MRVTNAHPAGTYTLRVTAFNSTGVTTTKNVELTVTTPASCDPVSFAPSATLGAGIRPFSIAVGDFNGDGKQDFVNYSSNNLSVLLGNGSGSFGVAANFSV